MNSIRKQKKKSMAVIRDKNDIEVVNVERKKGRKWTYKPAYV